MMAFTSYLEPIHSIFRPLSLSFSKTLDKIKESLIIEESGQ
jgi:hypothetical protein